MHKSIIPVIVLAVGFTISYGLYLDLRSSETERAVAEFDRRAANILSVLTNGIKGYSTAMETLKNITEVSLQYSEPYDFSDLSNFKTQKEEWGRTKVMFNQMAQDAGGSFPGLYGLGWILSVPYTDLKTLELGGKLLISPDYEIQQLTSEGGMEEVTERDNHFPIWYVEPLEQNKVGLGLDLSSASLTRDAIIEVRDTGKTVSTPPISWIKVQTGQLGFLVFDAVYYNDDPMDTVEERRGNLHSISFATVLVDDMLNSSLRGLKGEGLEFFVFPHTDEIEAGTPQAAPVYSSNGKPETLQHFREKAAASGFEQVFILDVLGRDWSLYCYPQSGFISQYQSSSPVIALTAGILITLLLAFYLFEIAGKTQRISAVVDERTQELLLLNEHLEREMASRLRANKDKQEMEQQLLQTQKMESVGQLAGGVAHDFNNLLQVILGYGEMAMDKVGESSPAHKNLKQVIASGERARVLVRQLLAFSRQQVLKLSELNLDSVIEDLVRMIRRIIGEHITLDFISGGDLGIIRADRGQLEQVLINLCVNARDAMGDGGKLTIETSSLYLDDAYCESHEWAEPGKYALLSVSDTGYGMDEETQQRIFDPFFTTKELGKGTGLGLSTAFGIVRQHNGTIEVSSEVGEGTTFNVYLPTADATAESTSQTESPEISYEGIETILLADDEEMVRSVTEDMLQEAGYTVLIAKDGEDAIALYESHKGEIGMALLDVVMPKLGGKAVADHIFKADPDIPILFCSGYSSDTIHHNFVLDEGMHLIQKPYNRVELLKRIREVIANVES